MFELFQEALFLVQFCVYYLVYMCCFFILLENNIRTKDFYFMMNEKLLDDNMMNTITSLYEQIIHVCPRLRGGA